MLNLLINIIISDMGDSKTTQVSKFGQTFIAYGSYHNNLVNKWIHIICVPIITCTMISAFSYIPISYTIAGYTVGVPEVFLVMVLFYYISINVGFAIGMVVLAFVMHLLWKKSLAGVNQENFFVWIISIHAIAWIFQFIGHGVFQRRKPALLDNLTQILNAPLFVVVEIFQMIGLTSNQMEIWKKQIEKNIEAFKQKSHSK